MPRDDFRKIPAFALELLSARALKEVELRVYLALLYLAGFSAPRCVRASAATIAETAGVARPHSTVALRAISVATSERPALIEYVPGINQHATAVVTIIEFPTACTDSVHPNPVACTDSVHPDAAACTDSEHPHVHPDVHPRHALAGETSPLDPESQRKSAHGLDETYLEEQAQRLDRAHGGRVDRGKLRDLASASGLPLSRFSRAVVDVCDRPRGSVRSPLHVLDLRLADERAEYETELAAIAFRNRPDCTTCDGTAHVPVDRTDLDSPYTPCPRCGGSGKEPTPEELLTSTTDERSTNGTYRYAL